MTPFANRYVIGKSFMTLTDATAVAAMLIGAIGALRLVWDRAQGRLQANPGK